MVTGFSSASALSEVRSSDAASSGRDTLASASPPVKSASRGALVASARADGVHSPRSSSEISSGVYTWMPCFCTSGTSGSLPPIRLVPATQPMRAWARDT